MDALGGTSKEWRLSRDRYYTKSGVRLANRVRREWNKSWMDDARVVSYHKLHTLKSASYSRVAEAVRAYCQCHATIWNEVSLPRHSALTMRVFSGKQRALDRFWEEVRGSTARDRLAVVYGVCYRSMPSTGRGEVSVPVKGTHKSCKRAFRTFDLDEFRTTKTCHRCGGEMKAAYCDRTNRSDMSLKKRGRHDREVRGLKVCTNEGCTACRKTCFVDRDRNSCWNFHKLAWAVERPAELARPAGEVADTQINMTEINQGAQEHSMTEHTTRCAPEGAVVASGS